VRCDPRLDRRGFARLALGSLASLWAAPGCGSGLEYTDADRAALDRQRRDETERAGKGPLGPPATAATGSRGTSTSSCAGRHAAARHRVPPAIDLHTAPGSRCCSRPRSISPARRAAHYYLDCGRDDPGCDFDLDVYQNANFSDAARRAERADAHQLLPWGGSAARTHTRSPTCSPN
jgi:hypothetical protein